MSLSTHALLLNAIHANDSQEFNRILETEALPEQIWWLDYELLMRALKMNRREIVAQLLARGCCVWKPYDKTTPLHEVVAQVDWYDVIDKLLCLGARVSATNTLGETPVHVAFKNKAPASILDTLIQSYMDETSASVCNHEGLGILHIACTRPKLEFVKHFFQFQPANIDAQVSCERDCVYAGYTPLHFAVQYGSHQVAAYLLERGANLYLQDEKGSSALHLAVECCDIKMINLVCNYVTKVNDVVNRRGLSHFMAVCASDDPSLVESFLTDPDPISLINNRVKDADDYPFAGYTPLHFAAVYDRVHTARLLLYCHGEELFWAATAKNHTAASLAFQSKRSRIAKLFSMYCEGGKSWKKEIKKIDGKSVVKKIVKKIKEDSFVSCYDFNISNILQRNSSVVGKKNSNDGILNDTLPVDDDDDGYCEEQKNFIDLNVCPKETNEASIQGTPLSTRSLYGKRDELFFTRIHELHKMSRRLIFNVDKKENSDSNSLSFFSSKKLTSIIVGTLFLLTLSVIVPSI